MDSENKKQISVIVCCYNSAARLPETLRHLSLQEVPEGFLWEVVVVDNNSTDGTAGAAEHLWEQYGAPAPLRVVREPQPGLSYARKKGVEESRGEYLIFCDDDNWLDRQYIHLVFQTMAASKNIGILGGHGIPVYEIEPGSWFVEGNYVKELATGHQDITECKTDITHKRRYVYGAGMAIQKELALAVFSEPFLLADRIGTQLISGGDVEICYKAILRGYQIWYDPYLEFKHFMPQNRLTYAYIKSLSRWKAYSSVLLNCYKIVLNEHYLLKRQFIWLRILHSKLQKSALILLSSPKNIESKKRKEILKAIIRGELEAICKFNFKIDYWIKQIRDKKSIRL